MRREEVLDAQILGKTVSYRGEEYYVRWLSLPSDKPHVARIGKTQTTIWRSNGEVIGDPHPVTVDVKELT